MLALSPPPFFSTSSWTLEDLITPKFHDDTINYPNISPSPGETESDTLLPSPTSSCPRNNGESPLHALHHPITISKKINHNANERDRRKKVNNLYSNLRSLLPAADQTKKLSIPGTVSQVLKYIPQLQKEVEGLVNKKEKLLSAGISRQEDVHLISVKKKRKCSGVTSSSMISSISVSPLGDREVVIQISAVKGINKYALIDALEHLEEENGLLLLNASSFKSCGEQVFNSFHLQVQDNHKAVESEMLRQKLLLFYEKTEEQLH